jgi:hypothetical protein
LKALVNIFNVPNQRNEEGRFRENIRVMGGKKTAELPGITGQKLLPAEQ